MRKVQWPWQTMALSPLEGRDPVGPGQGERPVGRTRPAVQGALVTYKTVGQQSSSLQGLLSLRSRFPWQPGPSFQAVGKSLRQRLARQPDSQPFHLSQKWLRLKNAFVGAGRGRVWRLGEEGQCLSKPEPGNPLTDHFSKASLLRPLGETVSFPTLNGRRAKMDSTCSWLLLPWC